MEKALRSCFGDKGGWVGELGILSARVVTNPATLDRLDDCWRPGRGRLWTGFWRGFCGAALVTKGAGWVSFGSFPPGLLPTRLR